MYKNGLELLHFRPKGYLKALVDVLLGRGTAAPRVSSADFVVGDGRIRQLEPRDEGHCD